MTSLDPWRVTATGQGRPLDLEQIRQAAEVLLIGSRHEIRTLPQARTRYVPGMDADTLQAVVSEMAGSNSVYFTLNPVVATRDGSARNEDVERRQWLFIDIDPIRPADVCATDEEKQATVRFAGEVEFWLAEQLWSPPIVIDSGNGLYLLFRIDLPNDALSKNLIASVLRALAEKFCDGPAKIDKAVANSARIARLPGTWNTKGPNTPERPHRLCRIEHMPYRLETISLEQLQFVAGTRKQRTATSTTIDPWTLKAGDDRMTAYLRRALESELLAVALSNPGERNTQLNKSAFACGQLIPHGLSEFEVTQGLTEMARRCGLADKEIATTVTRAVMDGREQPRELPATLLHARSVETPKPLPEDAQLVICANRVQPRKVKWIWPLRVPLGFISLFAGQTGQGKSFVTLDLAARLSKGRDLPDGPSDGECRRTLIISEDPFEFVLVPRLLALDADLSQIHFMTWESMASYSLADTETLSRAFHQAGEPTLIVIDPPTNFLKGRDEHKNTEVRQVLMNLVGWLQDHDAACILITHMNKQVGKGIDALSRIIGSVAWATTCRVALQFFPDPEDPSRSLMASPKNNLGEVAKTLAYKIVKTNDLAVVEWLGEVDFTAQQASNGEKRQPRAVNAAEWLAEQFVERREWFSDDIRQSAIQAGLSKNAIWEAKDLLPIKCRKITTPQGDQKWMWIAEAGWPPDQDSREGSQRPKNIGNLECDDLPPF